MHKFFYILFFYFIFMFNKLREVLSKDSYSPVTLFEVKNIINGEEKIDIPYFKKKSDAAKPVEPVVVVKKVVKSVNVKKDKMKVDSKRVSGEDEFILNFLSGKDWVRSTDLLSECLNGSICSRATFFRKISSLVKSGRIVKKEEGKERFYSVK